MSNARKARAILVLSFYIIFNGCVGDDYLSPIEVCQKLRIQSIKYPNSTKQEIVFHYDQIDNLVMLENWPNGNQHTRFFYVRDNELNSFETYRTQENELVHKNLVEYDFVGNISRISQFRMDSIWGLALHEIKEFAYDSLHRLVEYKVKPIQGSSNSETHKHQWENGNIVRKDVFYNSEPVYILLNEYDDKPNFMNKSIHFFLETPSNWTANNVLSFNPIDLVGYIDFFCTPCDFEYSYDTDCEWPIRMNYLPFNSEWEMNFKF